MIFRSALSVLSLIVFAASASAQQVQWGQFNGDLKATKFSPLTQITPENVKNLRVAWRVRTGDKSDGTRPRPATAHQTEGAGKTPATVWSATPLVVNDTVYLGTPFYRIFALEPDTGKVKWIYRSEGAARSADAAGSEESRRRLLAGRDHQRRRSRARSASIIGTMDAKLHSVDADTGKPCADFGNDGMVDVNQWNVVNAKWPLSVLQPPTVYKDFLFVGWAGKDWADAEAPPGTVFALDARTGALRWTFESFRRRVAAKTGTANVWASMSIDPERGILYLPVSSPQPELLWRQPAVADPDGHVGHRARDRNRQGGLEPPARASRPVGLRHQLAADPDRHQEGRPDHSGAGADVEAGLPLRAQPHTGEPIYPIEERPVPTSTCRAKSRRRRSLMSTCRPRPWTRNGRACSGSPTSSASAHCSKQASELDLRRPVHAAELERLADLSRHDRRRGMGRRRGRSAQQYLCRQSARVWCRSTAAPARGLRQERKPAARRPAGCFR